MFMRSNYRTKRSRTLKSFSSLREDKESQQGRRGERQRRANQEAHANNLTVIAGLDPAIHAAIVPYGMAHQ
ncbi:hypothetical protein [Roseibium sp. LAB1]